MQQHRLGQIRRKVNDMSGQTQNETHFMIDCETLGLTPDSVVLSVGVVQFDPYDPSYRSTVYYAEPSPTYQAIRKIDPDTLAWWEPRTNMPHGDTLPHEVCRELSDFILRKIVPNSTPIIWARGTDFDIPLLTNLFAQYDLEVPWKYNQVRDLRTISKLFPNIVPTANNNPHNALSDALCQAEHCGRILRRIKQLEAIAAQS